jgi:hypothetical protein
MNKEKFVTRLKELGLNQSQFAKSLNPPLTRHSLGQRLSRNADNIPEIYVLKLKELFFEKNGVTFDEKNKKIRIKTILEKDIVLNFNNEE